LYLRLKEQRPRVIGQEGSDEPEPSQRALDAPDKGREQAA
jgi:hypothetical protein